MSPFHFERPLTGGIRVVNARDEHAEQLEELQRVVFPTLNDGERFKAAHYRKHIALFPEGQFVALDGDRVVGAAATIRMDFDFDHVDHTFGDVIQGGWLTSHDPAGAWLYGADLGVHPEYRRRGLARGLVAACHDTVRALGLRGQVAVGMMSGYGSCVICMTRGEYFERFQRGEILDPTLSAQRAIGFEMRSLVEGYLDDPICDGCGVLIVLPAERNVPVDWQDACV